LEWEFIISVFSTAIAASAVIISWIGLRKSTETARRQDELTGIREWRQDVGNWASEALGVLSEASYACEDMPENASPKDYFHSYLRRLWALIDRGRFLLPNQQPERRWDPVPAFRGYRNAALDPLWAAGNVMEDRIASRLKKDVVQYRRHVLEELQREFTSKISVLLVPEQQVRDLLPNETPPGDQVLLDEVVPRVVERQQHR
jgi:hypothetical protein